MKGKKRHPHHTESWTCRSKVALSQKLKYSFPVFWHILPTHMPEDTYPKRLGHKIDMSRVLLCKYCIS